MLQRVTMKNGDEPYRIQHSLNRFYNYPVVEQNQNNSWKLPGKMKI